MSLQNTRRMHSWSNLSTGHIIAMIVLREVIGWHFLYEGLVKLANPDWSSAAFLAESKWLLSDLFHWIVSNPPALRVVDQLNVWGLTLIGLGLMLGFLTRFSCISGIVLLSLYYLANPSLIESTGTSTEGHYLIVDKNLVEMAALLVISIVPTGMVFGLDGIIWPMLSRRRMTTPRASTEDTVRGNGSETRPDAPLSRADLLKGLAVLPVLGAFICAYLKRQRWHSFEEQHLLDVVGSHFDAVSRATAKTFHFASIKDLKGPVPQGRIGKLGISRLILGGNLISGYAHARDLIYVSQLVKSYHTEQKVFDTLCLAERCGINAILTNPSLCGIINRYWRTTKGGMQFISNCGYKGDLLQGIKLSIDGGARAGYIHGEIADRLVREGKTDEIAGAIELIHRNGLPAGIGAHSLETVKACVQLGLKPDFWVKTLHSSGYWSAQHPVQHDNTWCTSPSETIEVMRSLEQPWIAFKVLAAGAIHPKDGFPFAFQNGADFVCVGMYDFQIVEDANIIHDVLSSVVKRKRFWQG